MKERIEKIKTYFRENKETYVIGGVFAFAGITVLYMRNINNVPYIDRGISVVADRGISVIADRSTVTNNVSLISSRRQGSPSWIIRCIETDKVFTSQRKAAKSMDIAESELSKHLNGLMDNVRGFTFERICLAA